MQYFTLNKRNSTPFLLLVAAIFMVISASAQNIQLTNYHDGEQSISEIYHVKDTSAYVMDGEYTAYHANGKIKTHGSYQNNQAIGIWKYYFENGALKMQGDLQPDQNQGFWEYYFENGQKSMEGILKEGARQGEWKFYFEQGGVKSIGKFLDGSRNGKWDYFYEDGTLKADAIYENNKGRYTEYFRSGSIKSKGINNKGKSEGLWYFYYENKNQKAVGKYKNGLKTGLWKYYHESGKPASQGNYKEGKTDGKWTYFHENGIISAEGNESEGVKDGFWKLYHKSGVFKGESTFMQGEGPYKEYYESGNLKIEGYIKNEKNNGKWLYYYEDGNLEGESDFVDGVGEFKGYYKDQKIRMEGTIKDGLNVGVWKLYKPNGKLAGYYTTVYNEDGVAKYAMVKNDTIIQQEQEEYVIPEFLFKNRKVRYFQPKIHEFKGLIIGTNPFAVAFGSFPVSIEYYMQERLGYELLFNYIRNPFFSSDAVVPFNDIYKRGGAFRFRQKFYQADREMGMLYFGHEVSYTKLKHAVNIEDVNLPNGSFSIDANESTYEYAIIIGNRMMKYAGKTGVTLDMHVGIGLGYRVYNENFPAEAGFIALFKDVSKSKLSVPLRLGFNLGYAF